MSTPVAFFLTLFACIILEYNQTYSYKSAGDLRSQLKKAEKERFSTTDVWVGKVMDFINTNKTMMGLLAGELWNVGTKAIDKIVEVKTGSAQKIKTYLPKPSTVYSNIQNSNIEDPNTQYSNIQYSEMQNTNVQNPNIQYPDMQKANIQNPNMQYSNLQNSSIPYQKSQMQQ